MRLSYHGTSEVKILFVCDTPTQEESDEGRPLAKHTVQSAFTRLLAGAKIPRSDCGITFLCKNRHESSQLFENKGFSKPTALFHEYCEELKQEILACRPNIIVALGNISLKALTGESSTDRFRGTLLPCTLTGSHKVLSTYHFSKIFADQSFSFLITMDLRKIKNQAEFAGLPEDNRVIRFEPTPQEFIDYCDSLTARQDEENLIIACDIENTIPDGFISWIGFAPSADFAMSIAFLGPDLRTPTMNENDELAVWQAISRLMSTQIKMVGHNFKHDVGILWEKNHILCQNPWFDTMIAFHNCFLSLEKSLGFVCSVCLTVPAWKHTSKGFTKGSYNALDCCNTRALVDVLIPELIRSGANGTFWKEMQQFHVGLFMELRGVLIDTCLKECLTEEYAYQLGLIKDGLKGIIGKEVNFGSPKQLADLLYRDLGLPAQYKRRKKKTDKRTETTDADALKFLSRETGNPILKLILEHRRISKILSTYLYIDLDPDNKVHTSYNTSGTSTGRWSSSASIIIPSGSGNLQNIPRSVREMYIAPPGFRILQADYKQAEAVVVAYLILDFALIKLFQDSFGLTEAECEARGFDIHKITAAMIFDIMFDEVDKDQRKSGKKTRHSTNYMAGPGILAAELEIKLALAKTYLEAFHTKCPQLKTWQDSIMSELKKTRTLTTPMGRVRKFLGRVDQSMLRSACAFKPQSTVGDLLNVSIVDFYNKWGNEVEVWMQLHDAIYILYPENESPHFWIKNMRESMMHDLTINGYTFQIDVDFKEGETWNTLKGITYDESASGRLGQVLS